MCPIAYQSMMELVVSQSHSLQIFFRIEGTDNCTVWILEAHVVGCVDFLNIQLLNVEIIAGIKMTYTA